jgi:elongation factor G
LPGDIGAVAKIADRVQRGAARFTTRIHSPAFARLPHADALHRRRDHEEGRRQRLFDVLHKLESDPCLWIERHPTTHETVMLGLGDLHMRTKLEDEAAVIRSHQAAEDSVSETVTKRGRALPPQKQTGGAGQFGEVF